MKPEEAIKLRGGDDVWMPDVSSQTVECANFESLTMDDKGVIEIQLNRWLPQKSTELYMTESEAQNVLIEWHLTQIAKHQAAISELRGKQKEELVAGTLEDERCNRDGCDGVMEVKPPVGCTCHINPPCSACEHAPIYCPKCGKEVPNGQ